MEAIHAACFEWGSDPKVDASLRKLCPRALLDEYYRWQDRAEQELVLELAFGG